MAKRTPDRLKIIAGTARPDWMNPDAPAAPSGHPEPPAWFSERATEVFQGILVLLDDMGLAS
jgi:hypothetical protein